MKILELLAAPRAVYHCPQRRQMRLRSSNRKGGIASPWRPFLIEYLGALLIAGPGHAARDDQIIVDRSFPKATRQPSVAGERLAV